MAHLSSELERDGGVLPARIVLVQEDEGRLVLADVEVELGDGQALQVPLEVGLGRSFEVSDEAVDLALVAIHRKFKPLKKSKVKFRYLSS